MISCYLSLVLGRKHTQVSQFCYMGVARIYSLLYVMESLPC